MRLCCSRLRSTMKRKNAAAGCGMCLFINEKVGFLYTVLHSKTIRNANKC
jgi:hypothetical protein